VPNQASQKVDRCYLKSIAFSLPFDKLGIPAAWFFSSFAGHFFALQGEKMTCKRLA
jgi:hypothetical protein